MSEIDTTNPAGQPEGNADAQAASSAPLPAPIENVSDGSECSQVEGCGDCADCDGCGGGDSCTGECPCSGAADDNEAEILAAAAEAGEVETSTHLVAVRYGLMSVQADFLTDIENLHPGDMVIMKTERGIDHGMVSKRPMPVPPGCAGFERIIRKGTESDHNILAHIKSSKEPEELKHCHERIAERGLPMKLAGIEHLFGGDKVIFYFLADGRVDFRELVKDLARRYRTRIEMRQIGVRDEAKMLSDYEHCGRELCCRTFMRELEPVTMRMAKIQKSTLDPSKISGHCGRLMCCLRFEDDVYKEHKKTLPHRGDSIRTQNVGGRVLKAEILSQLVEIEQSDGTRVKVHVDEIIDREKGINSGDDDDSERAGRPRGPQRSGGPSSRYENNNQRGRDNKDGRDSRGSRGGRRDSRSDETSGGRGSDEKSSDDNTGGEQGA